MSIDLKVESITCARGGFEAVAIQDRDAAPPVMDQLARLQAAGGGCDTDSAYAEHERKKLLCHIKRVRLCAILGHQQPSREPFLDDMKTCARGSLCELTEKDRYISVQKRLQRRKVFEMAPECRGVRTPGRTRTLGQSAQ
ncbi:hypothetical protein GCM10009105_10270 [Dokdonella soli]|uniref:Transposase DDE domain-containing protein n=1 Tax=Dokdonella soli TaxID=529810 RepID=A0ABP3TJY9_9GAMM